MGEIIDFVVRRDRAELLRAIRQSLVLPAGVATPAKLLELTQRRACQPMAPVVQDSRSHYEWWPMSEPAARRLLLVAPRSVAWALLWSVGLR